MRKGLGRCSRFDDFMTWCKANKAKLENGGLTLVQKAALAAEEEKREKEAHVELLRAVDFAAGVFAAAETAVHEETAHPFAARAAFHAAHNESYALRCEHEAASRASRRSPA